MITRKQSGFTLIELLTVIAIIAVLAAIIFPVMSAAKAQAKRTQCISNMEQIYQAVQLFMADEHRYPEFIAGPVQWKIEGGSYVPDANGNRTPLPLTDCKGVTTANTLVGLYPEYIKSSTDLKCPLANKVKSIDVVQDPMYEYLRSMDWTDRTPPLRAIGQKDLSGNLEPFYLYKASTYDIQLPKGSAEDEVHYSTVWTNEDSVTLQQGGQPATNPGISGAQVSINDLETRLAIIQRQLKWRQPPSDTVVTWCSLHRDAAGDGTPDNGSKDVILFLDGNAKLMPSKAVFESGWVNVWEKINPNTGK